MPAINTESRGKRAVLFVATVGVVMGISVSYAFGALGATPIPGGHLYQGGVLNFGTRSGSGWTANAFSCDANYTLVSYHYDEGSTNNATWYACIPSTETVGGTVTGSTDTCDSTCVDHDNYCELYPNKPSCSGEGTK